MADYNTFGFEPYGNNILIKLDEVADVSAGGIYIPTQAKDEAVVATVLAVGPGQKTGFDGTTVSCISK